jgi:hypothetical protein
MAELRAVIRSRPLARATAASVISCSAEGMMVACTPLLAAAAFGAPEYGALLLSGIALSALAAGALYARRPHLLRPDTVIPAGAVVLCAAWTLAAAADPVLLVSAAVLAGIGEGPRLTALFAVRHREAPERLRAQVFTTGASLKLTGFAVGAGIAGPLAARSLSAAMLTAALLELLAALSSWAPGRGPSRLGRSARSGTLRH